MGPQSSNDEIAIRIATAALADQFARLDPSYIEATVQRHLAEVHARARVTTFVGIIAERHAREELQELERSAP